MTTTEEAVPPKTQPRHINPHLKAEEPSLPQAVILVIVIVITFMSLQVRPQQRRMNLHVQHRSTIMLVLNRHRHHHRTREEEERRPCHIPPLPPPLSWRPSPFCRPRCHQHKRQVIMAGVLHLRSTHPQYYRSCNRNRNRNDHNIFLPLLCHPNARPRSHSRREMARMLLQ